MNDLATFEVPAEEAGQRVDVVIAAHVPEVSRTLARTLIDGGQVTVNGGTVRPSHRVKAGDQIAVQVVTKRLSAAPGDFEVPVVYRDADLAVLDKPAGLVVHPAAGHESGTLANALAAMFPETGGVGPRERPGIVHRLDKDTSGLMVVALSPAALSNLQEQIRARAVDRRYLALAGGEVTPAQGIIEAPVGRDERDRKRMAVHGIAARPARTGYQVLEYLPGFTLVEAKLFTGRTHQIRVHFAAMGHPLAGDALYHGAEVGGLQRQFLHAYKLSLQSPSTGDELHFTSALPPDLRAVLERLRGQM